MNAAAILSTLHAAGLAVQLNASHTDYRLLVSPRSALTDQHRYLIAQHRDELISVLYERRCDEVWPVVDVHTAAIEWACSHWPGDAPELLPGIRHYKFVEDAMDLDLCAS